MSKKGTQCYFQISRSVKEEKLTLFEGTTNEKSEDAKIKKKENHIKKKGESVKMQDLKL